MDPQDKICFQANAAECVWSMVLWPQEDVPPADAVQQAPLPSLLELTVIPKIPQMPSGCRNFLCTSKEVLVHETCVAKTLPFIPIPNEVKWLLQVALENASGALSGHILTITWIDISLANKIADVFTVHNMWSSRFSK